MHYKRVHNIKGVTMDHFYLLKIKGFLQTKKCIEFKENGFDKTR